MVDAASEDDPLDRLLARCRPTPPGGLAERVVAASSRWEVAAIQPYGLLVAEHARGALKVAAVLLVAALTFAVYTRRHAPAEAESFASERDAPVTVDQVALVTASGPAYDLHDGRDLWALDGEGE